MTGLPGLTVLGLVEDDGGGFEEVGVEGYEALAICGEASAGGDDGGAGHAGVVEGAVDEVELVGDGGGEVGALFGGEFEGHGVGDVIDGIDGGSGGGRGGRRLWWW